MDELHAAGKHYSDARVEIGVIKFWGAKVLYNVIDRAIQVHGSLGYTTDLPLEAMYRHARAARIYDGPDEVHKVTVARQVLKGYRASETRRPSTSRPAAPRRSRSSPTTSTASPSTAESVECVSAGQADHDDSDSDHVLGLDASAGVACRCRWIRRRRGRWAGDRSSSAPVKPSGSSACWVRAYSVKR